MNVGQTLFAQVMDYVPWTTVGRIIPRHGGVAGVRTLSCADLFRVGLKRAYARSTLSDALNLRDWHIYQAFFYCD
jgi:Domain of unknown function (DUF4372)